MDTLYSAYETALGLWLADVYRDLHKNRTFGSLRLLLKLRNTRFLKGLCYLVLNCRGDAGDPLVEFLVYLTALVAGDAGAQADPAFNCSFDAAGQPNAHEGGYESSNNSPQNQQNGPGGAPADGNFTPMNSHERPGASMDEAEVSSLTGTPTKMNSSSLDRTPTRRLTLLPRLSFRKAVSSSRRGERLKFKGANRSNSRGRLRRLNSPIPRPNHGSSRQAGDSRLLPGYVVFISMFLSALVPILLYTYIQRAKDRRSSQMDVVHDLYRLLSGSGMQEFGSNNSTDQPSNRTNSFDCRMQNRVFRSFRTTSELSLLKTASFGDILSIIGRQNLENELATYKSLFDRFCRRSKPKRSDSSNLGASFSSETKNLAQLPMDSSQVDNTSGLQMLLYRIALMGQNGPGGRRSSFLEVPRDVYSLHSSLDDSVLRAQLESSLIYCYRLRINDLNLKLNVNKLFKNVIKFSKSAEGRSKRYFNPVARPQPGALLRRSSSVNWTTVASPASPAGAGATCGLSLYGLPAANRLSRASSLGAPSYMRLNSTNSVSAGGGSGTFGDLDILNLATNTLAVFGSNLVYLSRVLSTTASDGASSSNSDNYTDTTLTVSDRHIFTAYRALRLINSSSRPNKPKASGSNGTKATNNPTDSPIADSDIVDGLKRPMRINNMEYLYNILLHLIRFIFELKRGPRPSLLTYSPSRLLREIRNSSAATAPDFKTTTNHAAKITLSTKYDVFKRSAGTPRVFVNDTLCLLVFKINFEFYRLVFPNTALLDELCRSVLPAHASGVPNSAYAHRGLSLPSEPAGAACNGLLAAYLYPLYTYVNLLATFSAVKRRIGFEAFPIAYWLVCSHLRLLQTRLDSQCQSKPP